VVLFEVDGPERHEASARHLAAVSRVVPRPTDPESAHSTDRESPRPWLVQAGFVELVDSIPRADRWWVHPGASRSFGSLAFDGDQPLAEWRWVVG
jgi:hypothetical protein